MPVEIKELIIRIATSSGAATTGEGGAAGSPAPAAPQQEAIVEACVKQVLKILEKKKAR